MTISSPLDEQDIDEEWQDINGEFFDYYNVDVKLLIIHVLLEGFYRGQKKFTLAEFLKGEYWKIEEISEEITDTNDYGSVEDLVLKQTIAIINDLRLGTITAIKVNYISRLMEKAMEEAIKTKDDSHQNVEYYTSVMREIYDLKQLSDAKFKQDVETGQPTSSYTHDAVLFKQEDYWRHLQFIAALSAPFIEIEIDFNDDNARLIHSNTSDFIDSFSQDDYIEHFPFYRQKRLYFSKQLENFYTYIKDFPVLNGYVNIPFSSLAEPDFEVIKVMSYLEVTGRIKVRNWNDTNLWNVRFHTLPITLSTLMGEQSKSEKISIENNSIKPTPKLKLSFALQTAVMMAADSNGIEYKIPVQGQVQKEVLRVIFRKPEKVHDDWSLYDISELLGSDDVDVRAVKNALYQFNKKVQLKITFVDKLFEVTQHTARLNPKYIEKT